MGSIQIVKFMKVFSLENFLPYSTGKFLLCWLGISALEWFSPSSLSARMGEMKKEKREQVLAGVSLNKSRDN